MSKYTNPGPISFTATIQRNQGVSNSSAWLIFPHDLKTTYGVGNLVPVEVVFDERVTYRGSLAKMGGPDPKILLRKDIRQQLGKEPGEKVRVVVKLDDKPRELAVAQDITEALKSAKLLEMFNGLAFTHRREYVQWIEGAKKPETRSNRIEKMCAMLTAGQKDPR